MIGLSASLSAMAADDSAAAGRKAEEQSCLPCHSLRLIDSQRLPAAAWQKEVDKMIGWGAVVPDRQLLIDYLSQHYSNTMPPPAPVLSANTK
jgi:quinoprotein glucose dehydrogenase